MKYPSERIIKDRKIRLGIVGCGNIAQKHLAAIQTHENDLDLIAACDSNSASLDTFIGDKKITGYINLDHMLQSANIDAVVLCSPSGLHPSQTIAAAKKSIHVITEKPMATTWEDGLSMVAACDDANVNLFVVKQCRYTPAIKLLKDAIVQNRFGKIFHVNKNVYWTRPQSYYAQSQWRGTKSLDGGALMNQASHYADLLSWLVGPIKSVHAMTATLGRQIESEDTCVLNVLWKSGAVGSMNVTMLTYPKNLETSMTILGEKGTVKLGGLAMDKIEYWEFADQQPDEIAFIKEKIDSTNTKETGHARYYENVIQVLRGEEKADIDGRAGLVSLELITAAYRSAEEGKTIELSFAGA